MSRPPGAGSDATLRDCLNALVEPWMDVLLLGLSPEVLDATRIPATLSTVRPGGPIPAHPWDVVVLRTDGHRAEVTTRDLARVLPNLRHGGQVVVVASDPATETFTVEPAALAPDLEVASPRRCADGTRVQSLTRSGQGVLDLVGLRRNLSTLDRHVGRIEDLLRDVGSKDAAMRPFDGQWSVKEWIGHLGDLDRDGYLRLLRGDPPDRPIRESVNALVALRDHQSRPLAEMVCRLRHFRYQSLEFAAGLDESAWRTGTGDLDGRPLSRADLVRTWVREEATAVELVATFAASR